jgi:hypothetical protein
MVHPPATPFDSVENAQEYFRLFSETLQEVQQEIEGYFTEEPDAKATRREEALRLVLFKLRKLEDQVKSSRRLLNDLRTLRRLLLHERVETPEAKAEESPSPA